MKVSRVGEWHGTIRNVLLFRAKRAIIGQIKHKNIGLKGSSVIEALEIFISP